MSTPGVVDRSLNIGGTALFPVLLGVGTSKWIPALQPGLAQVAAGAVSIALLAFGLTMARRAERHLREGSVLREIMPSLAASSLMIYLGTALIASLLL